VISLKNQVQRHVSTTSLAGSMPVHDRCVLPFSKISRGSTPNLTQSDANAAEILSLQVRSFATVKEMKLPDSEATIMARESLSSVNPDSWVDQHGDCLYRYALIRVRHPEVAKDLVQETRFTVARKYANFRRISSERSWLYGILKNKIFDYFRKLAQEVSFTDLEFLGRDVSQIH
jgi:Sigma-70 region 2